MNKVLYIHLDSADPQLIGEWAKQGLLPHLNSLMEQGSSIQLQAPRGFGADAMLPSVYTGADPSEHGRYYHSQETLGDVGPDAASNLDVECEPIWLALQRQGKRTVVLDLPKATVSTGFNGVHIANWKTHTSVMLDFKTVPPALAQRITEEYGPHTECTCYAHRYDKFDPSVEQAWLTEMCERLDAQKKMAKYYAQQSDWDVLMTGFCVSHCVGHQFWHLHDSAHPLHPSGRLAEQDPVRLIYQRLDTAVGELLELVDDNTRVMLFAGPGFGSSYLRWDLLDDILLNLSNGTRPADKRILETLKRVWHRLPDPVRRVCSGLAHKAEHSLADISRDKRPYYPARINDAVGGVIINKKRFSDQKEHRRVVDFLIAELAKVINLDTQTPIVRDIFATRDEYRGAHLERMPDIMILWDNDNPVSRVGSTAIGELAQNKLPDWSGTHRPYSLATLCSFTEKIELKSSSGSILDVAPTLADFAGASMPTPQGRSFLA